MPRLSNIFAAAALVLTVVLVNLHTHGYGFAYDDTAVILEREPVWEQGWGEFLLDRPWGLGRHVTVASLDFNRGGGNPPDPAPFHLTNTALAAVVVLALFALARGIGLSTTAAFAGSLLFAVHPLHVDAVVNIIGRAELLSAGFVVAVLLLHITGYPPMGFGLTAAGVLFLAGLESKESAACAPLLALAYDFFRPGRAASSGDAGSRIHIGPYVTFALALAAWLALAATHLPTGVEIDWIDNPLAFMPAPERVIHASAILWRYLGLVVWPTGLRADRAFDETPLDSQAGSAGLVAWLVVAVVLVLTRKKAPTVAFLLAWFPLSFAVTSNLVFPIGTIMAERLAYLPSAGPCLLAGLGFARMQTSASRLTRGLGHIALLACALTLALAYHGRSLVWTSQAHYHAQTAVDSPRSAKAHYNNGLALARADRKDQAVSAFRRALAIAPDFYLATDYLTRLLREQGDLVGAADAYAAYVERRPNDERALFELAHLYEKTGRLQLGHQIAQRLAELNSADPDYTQLLNRLEAAARAQRVREHRETPH